jgi:hypothetical protein
MKGFSSQNMKTLSISYDLKHTSNVSNRRVKAALLKWVRAADEIDGTVLGTGRSTRIKLPDTTVWVDVADTVTEESMRIRVAALILSLGEVADRVLVMEVTNFALWNAPKTALRPPNAAFARLI